MPPPSGGAGLYIGALLVLGALTVGLVLWQRSRSVAPLAPTPSGIANAAKVTAAPSVETQLPEFAPPALRQENDIASAAVAHANAPKALDAGTNGVATGTSACKACGAGVSNSELNAAVRGRAGTAQGCYQRALRDGGSEGTVTVSVSIGSDGSVCGANVAADTVNNPAISSCVVGKFRTSSFPRPNEGCVTVNVPITFKVK